MLSLILLMHFHLLPNERQELIQLYLNLMKSCLINSIYQDGNLAAQYFSSNPKYDDNVRENGKDWPIVAHTMIGLKRLNNIQFCVEDVLKNSVPGDLIETGVWRGGATIFMRAILKAYSCLDRLVWVADSFEGLPKPNIEKYPEDKNWDLAQFKELAVSLEQVKSNFKKYDLLDNQVSFLKGWFRDTLPSAAIKQIAVLRLDGDIYESTMDALTNLYPKLSVGGYIIIDDYAIPPCAKAVADYRKQHNITDEIKVIDWTGVYWQRTK